MIRLRSPLLGLLLCSACTVADNLSYEEMVTELDGIVTIEGEGDKRTIRYAENAPVSAWYMRQFWLWPIRWPLGLVFGVRHMDTLDNPSGHVRALLQELPDEFGGSTTTAAQATLRFGWIAELDENGNSRVVGLDGLAAVVEQFGIAAFPPDFETCVPDEDTRATAEAWTSMQTLRPEARAANAPPLGDTDVTKYGAALQTMTARPLREWTNRLLLVQDLDEMLRAETDERLAAPTEVALRAAIGHCVREILLRTVVSRERRFVDVRLCAMELIRRLGGPRTVPWLLAVMAASPAQLARGDSRYDPDPFVQLRLIQYCGQLRGPLAEAEVKLRGREDWQALAPIDFLAQAVLNEQAYYSKLRTPAMAALTLSLGRPRFDPDVAWVREWQRERLRRS